jgi:hypothetical protein
VPWLELAAIAVAGACTYGLVMGAYGLRGMQAFYSGIKVPLLLAVSSIVCLPSFYVINTLLGLRSDFQAACRGLLASQATLAVCLSSLAPVTVVAYLSSTDYLFAVLFNGIPFLLATLASQAALARHYAPLIQRNPRHRLGKLSWFGLYVFVAIQLAWVLRPFVGSGELETTFFRPDAWNNAYVRVATILWRWLGG